MRWILLSTGLVGVLLFILIRQRRWQDLSDIARGLLLSYLTIVLLVIAGESYFRFFFAEASASPLAHRNWLNRYWEVNAQSFRDRDWQPEDFAGKQVIVAIGDSFTAGTGINDPEDRWTNQLADMLGQDSVVVNVGVPGAATTPELNYLKSFDLAKPDVVIWQYFLNDMEYIGLTVSNVPDIVQLPPIAEQSHLLNFILYRLAVPDVDPWRWHYDAYDNVGLWSLHVEEIKAMADYVDGLEADLIVLIFPRMEDPVGSVPYVDRVEQAILATGHNQIIKFFDDVAAWPQDVPLIVSRYDTHPSVEFNRHVAEQIYQRFFGK